MQEEHFLISGFSGSKYEKLYLEEQLLPFYANGWIERVLLTIKRGKEAAVYCCQANPDSRWIFGRDVERVCEYFARYGIETDWQGTTDELWHRYVESTESRGYLFGEAIDTSNTCLEANES